MILDQAPCRPFDAHRAGLNLGEGAAYVVLESASSVAQRHATVRACLTGYGNACDAFTRQRRRMTGKELILPWKRR